MEVGRPMMRSAALVVLLVPLAAAASAATLKISFGDPPGDAKPNLSAIDITGVVGAIDDVRLTVDLRLQGLVEPVGNEYLCVADINPDLPAHPHYELSFADNRFAAKFHYGDSSPYTASTEGAAWSEQGIHFTSKRGETNAVNAWVLHCETKHANADGTKTGDYADKNSIPPPALPKAKGMAPAAPLAAAPLALVLVALVRRRA